MAAFELQEQLFERLFGFSLCGGCRLGPLGMVELLWQGALFGVGLHQNHPQIGEQVLDSRPDLDTAIDGGGCPRLRRQAADKHLQGTRRYLAAVEVGQLDPVDVAQVGLYRIAVLVEQAAEAG